MTTTVILGMHRSGTSLVAGLLHHLGIFMGEGFGNDGDWCHYEDPAFVSLNQQLLTVAGGSWQNPPSIQSIWHSSHLYNEQIQRLLRERSVHSSWGFKDPRACLTINLWHDHLCLWEKPKYIIVWRDKDKIITSLLQRAKARGDVSRTEAQWAQLVGVYWGRLLDFIVLRNPETYSVWYEQLVDPAGNTPIVEGLADFCDVPYTASVLSFIRGKT